MSAENVLLAIVVLVTLVAGIEMTVLFVVKGGHRSHPEEVDR